MARRLESLRIDEPLDLLFSRLEIARGVAQHLPRQVFPQIAAPQKPLA
ncbi:MAG TPA: hypothetical protein PK640_00890 [Verrucomicrobiota bacterium]|nr:hypothetical protein [Verrucomicrobiota bacterium]